MIFTPQQYTIPDEAGVPFLDPAEIDAALARTKNPSLAAVEAVVARSLAKNRLTLEETATLLNASSAEAVAAIREGARRLKQAVYGNRIVLFAPLYVGNRCENSCLYCGFRRENQSAVRKTLLESELVREVEALEQEGQKRLILVFGEHATYNAAFIADAVRTVYGVTTPPAGQIRRVNINAAPLDVAGFATVKAAGIGTYQIFQETYNPEIYRRYHPRGRKADYDYRLTSLDRAMEAGIDDVGLGALIGLGDWRFEAMALVRHTNHLEACFDVGPHTISFPRIKPAHGVELPGLVDVSDEEFTQLVAVLRLAVPYTGLILTAREPAALRDELISYGISQIDGGTRLEIGGYTEAGSEQRLDREQFQIGDDRSLAGVIDALVADGRLPSFCTACYRTGRTGEHFMEFSVPGFIKRFCTPNAILTFAEYLEDYGSGERAAQGWALIGEEMDKLEAEGETRLAAQIKERLERIRAGERDLLF